MRPLRSPLCRSRTSSSGCCCARRSRGRLQALPSDERWHDRPTPIFGGVGIFAGLIAGIGAAVLTGAIELTGGLVGIVAGCSLLFVAGLIDDTRHLSPLMKLAAQFGAAAIVIGSGLRVELFTNDIVAVVVAVVWLVGITNAFNLLDNMDGLAAALATIACAYFAIDAATAHPNDLVLILALSLGFACLGFLPFNLRLGRNAAVFMGDSGSQVLGFALASLGLAASWTDSGDDRGDGRAAPDRPRDPDPGHHARHRRPARRAASRSPRAARDHTSHRLVYYGLSEQEAVALLATVAIALGATGLAYNALDNGRVTSIGVLVSVVLLVQFGNFLAELREQRATGGARPSLVRSLLEPRRLVEIVTDFVLMCASLLVAYLFVFDGYGTAVERAAFLASLPVVLGTRYLFFVVGGIYRRVWRYAATVDELVIAVACGLSALVSWGITSVLRGSQSLPVSVFVLDAIFCTVLVGGSRLAFRLWVERADHAAVGDGGRVLIVGAGRSGRSYAREVRETPGQRVVGFLDDNPAIQSRRISGFRVRGALSDAGRVVAESSATEVVVTIANASRRAPDDGDRRL